MSENDWLTSREVAEILQCHFTTVAKLAKQGAFPGAKKFNPNGRTSPLRIPREDVIAFQKSQLISPKPEM